MTLYNILTLAGILIISGSAIVGLGNRYGMPARFVLLGLVLLAIYYIMVVFSIEIVPIPQLEDEESAWEEWKRVQEVTSYLVAFGYVFISFGILILFRKKRA